jgi:hypothetical protein
MKARKLGECVWLVIGTKPAPLNRRCSVIDLDGRGTSIGETEALPKGWQYTRRAYGVFHSADEVIRWATLNKYG